MRATPARRATASIENFPRSPFPPMIERAASRIPDRVASTALRRRPISYWRGDIDTGGTAPPILKTRHPYLVLQYV